MPPIGGSNASQLNVAHKTETTTTAEFALAEAAITASQPRQAGRQAVHMIGIATAIALAVSQSVCERAECAQTSGAGATHYVLMRFAPVAQSLALLAGCSAGVATASQRAPVVEETRRDETIPDQTGLGELKITSTLRAARCNLSARPPGEAIASRAQPVDLLQRPCRVIAGRAGASITNSLAKQTKFCDQTSQLAGDERAKLPVKLRPVYLRCPPSKLAFSQARAPAG